jgi:hypothetical protein
MSKGQEKQLGRILAGGKPLSDEEIAEIDDADAALRTQLKRFFEAGPFYQPWPVPGTAPRRSYGADEVVIPGGFRIEMACIQCDETTRTFVLDYKDNYNHYADVTLRADKGPHLIRFRCTHCDERLIGYLVYVGRNANSEALQIEKGGVYPSVRPQPSPELARGLGEAKSMFVNGLINQHFGFGIGAFGYYRRVAEDIIDRLLGDLREYADEAELKELVAAIDDAKKQHQAAEKIKIVMPLVPKILRPNGQNPLGTLFGALSNGLHGGTDQECLDVADSLRTALEFLIVKLESLVATPTQYAQAIKEVQEAKAKKAASSSKS